ncbi:hypothetical protein D3C87_1277670 [compost metagenome]
MQAHLGTDVEETEQAEGGVEDQTRGIDTGRRRLGLQDIVGEVGHIADVAEHVVDAVFKELRRHELVALGQRLQCIGIEHVVEFIDRAVDAFPRVIFRRCLGNERNQHRAGAHTKLS